MFKCCKAKNISIDEVEEPSKSQNDIELDKQQLQTGIEAYDKIINNLLQETDSQQLDFNALNMPNENPTPDIDNIVVTDFHTSKYYKSNISKSEHSHSNFTDEQSSDVSSNNPLKQSVHSQKHTFVSSLSPHEQTLKSIHSNLSISATQSNQQIQLNQQHSYHSNSSNLSYQQLETYPENISQKIQSNSQQLQSPKTAKTSKPQISTQQQKFQEPKKIMFQSHHSPAQTHQNSLEKKSEKPLINTQQQSYSDPSDSLNASSINSSEESYFSLHNSEIPIIETDETANKTIDNSLQLEFLASQNLQFSAIQNTKNTLPEADFQVENSLLKSNFNFLSANSIVDSLRVSSLKKSKIELMEENEVYRSQMRGVYGEDSGCVCRPLKIRLIGLKGVSKSVYQ